jgi:hypothetical protein
MPDEKALHVTDPRRGSYRRVIRTRPVTFTCIECEREVTEDVFPGPPPVYCNRCIREVHRRNNAERQRRYRARQRKQEI